MMFGKDFKTNKNILNLNHRYIIDVNVAGTGSANRYVTVYICQVLRAFRLFQVHKQMLIISDSFFVRYMHWYMRKCWEEKEGFIMRKNKILSISNTRSNGNADCDMNNPCTVYSSGFQPLRVTHH